MFTPGDGHLTFDDRNPYNGYKVGSYDHYKWSCFTPTNGLRHWELELFHPYKYNLQLVFRSPASKLLDSNVAQLTVVGYPSRVMVSPRTWYNLPWHGPSRENRFLRNSGSCICMACLVCRSSKLGYWKSESIGRSSTFRIRVKRRPFVKSPSSF